MLALRKFFKRPKVRLTQYINSAV